jgi:hypothetical protein
MKVTTIGCGNAFSNKSFNQSFVLQEGERKLLIDCGMQTPKALVEAGYKPTDIDDIYISHLHSDHVGGLEYFAFLRYDWVKRPRKWDEYLTTCSDFDKFPAGDPKKKYAPRLIANEQLLKDLWDKTLRGGLESMEGFVATLDTFFEPCPVEPNKPFNWMGWQIDLIQQIHIMSGSVIMPSFGIMLSKPGHKTIYFVTDSQHCSPRQMEEFYRRADIIIQDCECTGVNFQFAEGTKVYYKPKSTPPVTLPYIPGDKTLESLKWPTDDMEALELIARSINPEYWSCFKFGSGVHANFAQLAGYESANSIKLSLDIKAKMWLSHYQDFVLQNKDMYGNNIDWKIQAAKDGFAGFITVGQEIEL